MFQDTKVQLKGDMPAISSRSSEYIKVSLLDQLTTFDNSVPFPTILIIEIFRISETLNTLWEMVDVRKERSRNDSKANTGAWHNTLACQHLSNCPTHANKLNNYGC